MERLSYETLKKQNYQGYLLEEAPERILQFGEGKFVRSFVEHFIDILNEKTDFNSKVVVIQPRAPHARSQEIKQALEEQDNLYTLHLRGQENGQPTNESRVISCISRILNSHTDFDAFMALAENPELRFITCNTTETGIIYDPRCEFTDRPAASFPGKLTQFLYARYQLFGQEHGKGFVFLPCELFEDNGKALKKCILNYVEQWNLGKDFVRWIKEENIFCTTLVDRIVIGYPSDAEELDKAMGWVDKAMSAAEDFSTWYIESPVSLENELPFEKADLPVILSRSIRPYRERKIRILNGVHTAMVLGSYLMGYDNVNDSMKDEVISKYVNKVLFEEIVPTLTLPGEEVTEFANSVIQRLQNPYIDHWLLSIAEYSTSKWNARVLPSIRAYAAQNRAVPPCLTASLAFYIDFYCRGTELTEDGMLAVRTIDGKENAFLIRDDESVLSFFLKHKNDDTEMLVHEVCSNGSFWGKALTLVPKLEREVVNYLYYIRENGVYACMKMAAETER